jgi:hypothetical protein
VYVTEEIVLDVYLRMLGSDLCRTTCYCDWGLSRLSSAILCKRLNSTSITQRQLPSRFFPIIIPLSSLRLILYSIVISIQKASWSNPWKKEICKVHSSSAIPVSLLACYACALHCLKGSKIMWLAYHCFINFKNRINISRQISLERLRNLQESGECVRIVCMQG